MRVDTRGPEQPGVYNVGIEVFDSGVEVMDLAPRAVKDVQSYGRKGAVVLLAVLPNEHALHEAQVNPVGQVADDAGHFVRMSAHPLDVCKADVAVKVGDGRWVFRVRRNLIRVMCGPAGSSSPEKA